MAAPADPDFRHATPPEIETLLAADPQLAERWAALTPLARNEWICWTISAKQEATRQKRRTRLVEEVVDGKKRPCCWPGCPHRRDSARKWVDA
ncbi:YdeI/OmpD-associated family protein [Qipengyuania sp. XHP0207]|uniref:YdeI/OmpD-associated family protein n=1 Tax=Qipengyuania sp. XHP0207 TaxID=3038078 RepID=UPI00241D9E26|nr:YdeI/OmpD-associated family protein [Qipengyuania sp. XHP0207]MDG5747127.1 YdeI/OmpD-associated family protein [Qipengyuania sp. XHP0207]